MSNIKIATEQDAYNIGGSGSPTTNKCLIYSKAGGFNCDVTSSIRYTAYRLVRYPDLSVHSGGGGVLNQAGFYYGGHVDEDQVIELNSYDNTTLSDTPPLTFFRPYNDTAGNYENFFSLINSGETVDLALLNHLIDYSDQTGAHSAVDNTWYIIQVLMAHDAQVPDNYSQYGALDINGGFFDNSQTGYCFDQIRELGFIGCRVDDPTFFHGAPTTLQLIEIGAGYSYIMTDPHGYRYAVTGNGIGGPYQNWYNCQPDYTLYKIDDGFTYSDQELYFYDNVLHTNYEAPWRTNAFNPNVPLNVILNTVGPADDGLPTCNLSYELSDDPGIELFNVNQSQPHTHGTMVAGSIEYSRKYVPYLYSMFSNILDRCDYVRVDEIVDDAIKIRISDYLAPKNFDNCVVSYTLCVFQKTNYDGLPIEWKENTEEFTQLVGTFTIFDWDHNAVMEDNGGFALIFDPSRDEAGYCAAYTDGWDAYDWFRKAWWEEQDVMCYSSSLYITISQPGAIPEEGKFHFDELVETDPLCMSSFRIDFSPNFKSSIFYGTWQHEYWNTRFG